MTQDPLERSSRTGVIQLDRPQTHQRCRILVRPNSQAWNSATSSGTTVRLCFLSGAASSELVKPIRKLSS